MGENSRPKILCHGSFNSTKFKEMSPSSPNIGTLVDCKPRIYIMKGQEFCRGPIPRFMLINQQYDAITLPNWLLQKILLECSGTAVPLIIAIVSHGPFCFRVTNLLFIY
jgi:hypothetical protein